MGLFGREDKGGRPSVTTPAAASPTAATDAAVTLVARASRFKGVLSGSADVKIAGALEGEVDCSGTLVVTDSGTVKARLHARSVVVAGNVEGDVTADEKIELQPSARLRGDITAPRILIEEGATFEGQVFMKSPGKRPGSPEGGAKPQTEAPAKEPSPPQPGEEPGASRPGNRTKR